MDVPFGCQSSPIQIGSLTTWTKIASGASHHLGIASDGTLWSWGSNSAGQLGDTTTVDKSSPIQVGSLTTWVDVYTNNNSTYAIKSNNTLWTWGDNTNGILGDNFTINRSSPVQIGALTTWYKIAANNGAVVGLTNDWKLYSWGKNTNGQLGLSDTISRSNPAQIGSLNTWYDVGTSASNSEFFVAIQQNGSLWAWGRDNYSQTGIGDLTDKSSPVQVGILTSWNKIASGSYHCVAVNDTQNNLMIPGGLWGWGHNDIGELADSTTVDKSSPIQVGTITNWISLIAGNNGICGGLRNDGTIWTWGSNTIGGLGDSTTLNKSFPVQVGTLTTWKKLVISNGSVNSIKTDGTLWSWGANNYGQLGDGTNISKSSPIQVGILTTWKDISTYDLSIIALKTDGTIWTWGSDTGGMLGQNTLAGHLSSPVQVGILTTWKSISCGKYCMQSIRTDGTLWTWGGNNYGQLGDGTNISKSSPIQVGSLTTWNYIYCCYNNSFAIQTNGTLWSWGKDDYGELGHTVLEYKSNPVQIGTLTNWKQASSGNYNSARVISAAIKTDGTLWSWGRNSYGGLGQNNNIDLSSPVQVGILTNWKTISVGSECMLAIK